MNYNKKFVSEYLEALENEVKEYYNDEIITTMYIGGGTPSCLTLDELNKLFDIINLFKRSTSCEFTFECNPSDINDKLLNILKMNGVNRISIGVESFDKENLKFMERTIDYDDLKAKINLIRYKGINNINLDLMYAIPNESYDVLKKDVKLLLKLNPEHISTYSLIIEDNTKIKLKNYQSINEDLDYKMYEYICKKLSRKGYNHYEVSNFALNGYESIHNTCYWNNEEYYGFGLGASGYMNGFRYDNTKSLSDYINGKYHLTEALLSKKEIMDYEVMLGLRKMSGINLQEFYDKYKINMQEAYPIKPLIKSKELIYKKGNIYINPDYIYVMNEILLKLV
jgi:oxygen-independent coproporphyrinogen-3 oxidase